MDEALFETETWRGSWFYKFGSHYTGPFQGREDAIAAAMRDLSPIGAVQASSPVRASLGVVTPFRGRAEAGFGLGSRN